MLIINTQKDILYVYRYIGIKISKIWIDKLHAKFIIVVASGERVKEEEREKRTSTSSSLFGMLCFI